MSKENKYNATIHTGSHETSLDVKCVSRIRLEGAVNSIIRFTESGTEEIIASVPNGYIIILEERD